jgi:hypothetical protein
MKGERGQGGRPKDVGEASSVPNVQKKATASKEPTGLKIGSPLTEGLGGVLLRKAIEAGHKSDNPNTRKTAIILQATIALDNVQRQMDADKAKKGK